MIQDKYRIVKIIDDTAIVINAGKNNSINVGDEFQILGKNGEQVSDPDTGELLGEIELIKGIVIARQVYSKMTICSTETKSLMPNILSYNSLMYEEERLNVDSTQISGGLYSDEPVKIGDYVLHTTSINS